MPLVVFFGVHRMIYVYACKYMHYLRKQYIGITIFRLWPQCTKRVLEGWSDILCYTNFSGFGNDKSNNGVLCLCCAHCLGKTGPIRRRDNEAKLITKLAPEWVRTSGPVIRSAARYRWTTAPALLAKNTKTFQLQFYPVETINALDYACW